MFDLRVFPDAEALVTSLVSEWTEEARAVLGRHGRFAWSLAGGTTPRDFYERLAETGPSDVWSEIEWFWGDERTVPPEDPASNFGMARAALLSRVPVESTLIHRMRGELSPLEAAAEYERILAEHVAARAPRPPFDWALLGLGTDGHTASLFPGGAWDVDPRRLVVAEHVAHLDEWRLTLTPELLGRARRVVFLVTGSSKAEALSAVLEGAYDPARWPAQAVMRAAGSRVSFRVDRAAARLLAGIEPDIRDAGG